MGALAISLWACGGGEDKTPQCHYTNHDCSLACAVGEPATCANGDLACGDGCNL